MLQCHYNALLGKGGSSIVSNGTFNGQSVAIKRIYVLNLHDDFNKREEHALLQLNHPNVIKLLHIEADSHFR